MVNKQSIKIFDTNFPKNIRVIIYTLKNVKIGLQSFEELVRKIWRILDFCKICINKTLKILKAVVINSR